MHRELLQTTYENRLAADPRWAFREGSRHFEERSAVHEALRKITRRLAELGVPYAVVGGMALFRHGLRRFTEVVEILVTGEDLAVIHQELDGRGYVPPFTGSRNLRDAELGVRVEFLITGQYPGDGKEKPVAFPDPRDVSVELEGTSFIRLVDLVNLKLASGMTSPARLRDLADVQDLIKRLRLTDEFGRQLHPYVRDKFEELRKAAELGDAEENA